VNTEAVSGDLVIRPMTIRDTEAVYAIDLLSFSLPWSLRAYRFEVSENENARCLVAEYTLPGEKSTLAGMIVTWIVLDEAHIGTLAVHPHFRRKGIGRELLFASLRDALKEGCVLSYLEVRRGNLAAQTLYQKYGFNVVSVRQKYYADTGEDALLMTLKPIDETILNNPK